MAVGSSEVPTADTDPASAPTPPPLARRRKGFLRHALTAIFPREINEPRTQSGYAADVPHSEVYLALAVVVSAAFAALWWWIVRGMPLAPGDDPSTWILISYAYLGHAVPITADPFGYPPAVFPLLGFAVAAGNGPELGGRLFMAALILGLGVGLFELGRTVVRRPVLALVFEGLVLAEPDFQQLYYFGGYPNLLGLVFFTLTLSFFLRYLRSRRPSLLFGFWVALTLTALTHTLTAVILAATLGLLVLGLLIAQRLPRQVVWSRAGLAGILVLLVGVGGYYGGTAVLGVAHPSYIESGPVSVAKSQLVPSVLKPFYIPTAVKWFTHTTYTLTATTAVDLMVAATVLIVLVVLALRVGKPRYLTLSWLLLAASFLAVFLATIVGYERSINTDYRRFAYFLYPPLILTLAAVADLALREVPRRWRARHLRTTPRPARRRRLPISRSLATDLALGAVGIVLLIVVAQYATIPAATSYEDYYTLYAHDNQFISAVSAISASGIPGNILATTPVVARWPTTLTGDRSTYVPSVLGTNSYSPLQTENGELTAITLLNRYFVDNTLVGAGVPGVTPTGFVAAPVVGAFTANVYQPLVDFPTPSLEVGLVGGTVVNLVPVGAGAPPVVAIANGTGFQITYVSGSVALTENVTTPPNTSEVTVALWAHASNTSRLTFVQARIAGLEGTPTNVSAGALPGEFTFNATTRSGNFTAYGNTTPASALSKVVGSNVTGTGRGSAQVVIRDNATNASLGTASLSVGLTFLVPNTSNAVPALPSWITADATWASFGVRFFVEYDGSAGNGPQVPLDYLPSEYQTATLSTVGPWIILLLPDPIPPPPG
jgi:hypothetical protein